MKYAKKYLLIEPTRYDRLTAQAKDSVEKPEPAANTPISKPSSLVHPNIKRVNNIEKDMAKIISDDYQSDYDKVQKYASKLDSYLRNIRLALTQSAKDSIIGIEQKPSTLEDTSNIPKSINQLTSTIPKTYQGKANQLLKFMTDNGVEWDSNGVVKVAGHPIMGSNITQLVNDAVRQKRPLSERNTYQLFSEALKSRGVKIQPYEKRSHRLDDISNSSIPAKQRKTIDNPRQAWEELNM